MAFDQREKFYWSGMTATFKPIIVLTYLPAYLHYPNYLYKSYEFDI